MAGVKYDYPAFCAALAARDGHVCRVNLILLWRGPVVPSGLLTCQAAPAREPLEGHHLVPKQRIKRAWETVARMALERAELTPPEARLAQLALTEILEDARLGILACPRHHDLLERRLVRLFREDLPDGCVDFAEELGLGWSVDRDYPAGPTRRGGTGC